MFKKVDLVSLVIIFTVVYCLQQKPDFECAKSLENIEQVYTDEILSYNAHFTLTHMYRAWNFTDGFDMSEKPVLHNEFIVNTVKAVISNDGQPYTFSFFHNGLVDSRFKTDSKRNLTLLLQGSRLFVSIGEVLERIVHGSIKSMWICNNQVFDISKAIGQSVDFYLSQYYLTGTSDYIEFNK